MGPQESFAFAEEEIYSSSSELTFQMLLTSTATQLNISRFELRVLRFFNDICVPLLTFGVNKKHDYIYRHVMPRYFVSSRLMRQAIFSYGCLGLWPFLDVDAVLQADLSDEMEVLLLQDRDVGNLSVVLNDPLMFGENEDTNIFRRTAVYYSETLAESRKSLAEMKLREDVTDPDELEKLICVILSSSLIFGFLACHPHRVVPLICFLDDEGECKIDVLSLISGMKQLSFGSLEALRNSDVGELFHHDELTMVNSRKVPIVDELRKQMYEHYHAIQFLDFTQDSGNEILILNQALDMLATAIALSVKFNYPVALFRWLFTIRIDFGPVARKKNWIAMRILFVYSCLCLYCRFCLHRECIWRDYVGWFHREYQPLCNFDNRLYHYVITRDERVMSDKYLSLAKFDIWTPEFDLK